MKEIVKNDINIENNGKNSKKDDKKSKKLKIFAITSAIFGVTTVWFATGYAITQAQSNEYKNELENIYESNFYSLLDSVNNLENRLSKTINSSSSSYQRKTLLEASKNASEAEVAVSSLPLSQGDIQDTVKLVNQISGYTLTLADNLIDGKLSQDDYDGLEKVYESVLNFKNELNAFARKLDKGYSIIDSNLDTSNRTNDFTRSLNSFKDNNIEYPSMIYDGPFSDSVLQSSVEGLGGDLITKSQGIKNIQKNFKNVNSVEYESETNGKFNTYNYRVYNSENEVLFVQVTKIAGNILTISGAGQDGQGKITQDEAKQIALNFVSENGIENPRVVWQDAIENDVYLNIAPVQGDVILYPDLVKVKVNLASGTVVGYDATAYFTNHKERKLGSYNQSVDELVGRIPYTFEILQKRKTLSPLDYNREVLCYEIEAKDENSDVYYFYFNAQNGELENVLKVIKTDDGNLLM